MANIRLQFVGNQTGEGDASIEVFANVNDDVYISIANNDPEEAPMFLTLDLSTAIRFDKELRKAISEIKKGS